MHGSAKKYVIVYKNASHKNTKVHTANLPSTEIIQAHRMTELRINKLEWQISYDEMEWLSNTYA